MYREELREIFIPQFQKILTLINDQIQQVNSRFGPRALQVIPSTPRINLKLVFLVGGLGSNEFLFAVIWFPASEKSRSEATEVAGMPKYFFAIITNVFITHGAIICIHI